MKLKNKTVILGVTGGIAAYKAPNIVRTLQKEGADVHVVLTESAKSFISPLTFEALTSHPVSSEILNSSENQITHIALANKADILLIAPATANTIAKIAYGFADNLLTAITLATKAPLFIAPAMNCAMYNNPATQANIETLKNRGWNIIGPELGTLACGDTGIGKMSSEDKICTTVIDYMLQKDSEKTLQNISNTNNSITNNNLPLKGKKIIITAGPTQEPIDPVRFITNKSSGKMGYALAEKAQQLGGDVVLISGPVNIPSPNGCQLVKVETADEMLDAVKKHLPNSEIFIGCAAVADYKAKTFSSTKIKKEESESITIEFVKNPDILKHVSLSEHRPSIVIGFAAETNNCNENALSKLKKKGVDYIILNDVSRSDIGFNSNYNSVTVFSVNNDIIHFEKSNKNQIASDIFELCLKNRY
jgi:phosphopantothenoylcysteine decarboxylase/phosphopantothenate--cysteine ligase